MQTNKNKKQNSLKLDGNIQKGFELLIENKQLKGAFLSKSSLSHSK